MPTPTRYEEIARQIREDVVGGRYGEEGRIPGEADLSRRFGVSRPTTARALRALVSEGLIERRAGSGTFARPRKSHNGNGTGEKLFALIPNVGNTDVFTHLCGEIASLTRANKCSLLWGGSHQPAVNGDIEQIEKFCRHFIERHVSGIFFAPYELTKTKDLFNTRATNLLHEAGIPLVLLDRDWAPFPMRSNFDLVSVDNFVGGFMAAEHLLKLRCKRIDFVTPTYSASSVDARIAGVRDALGRMDGDVSRNWIHIGDTSSRKFVREILTPKKPDAIICANDHTAIRLIHEFRRLSVRVPEDIRIVGFDGLYSPTLISPELTTIQQPCRELALAAVRAMLDRQESPGLPARQITILPRLVVRESCGTYLPPKR